MKAHRFIGFTLCAILLCLSACSNGGDDPIEPTPKPEVIKSEITIDSNIISNGLSFSNVAGDQSISFTTNENWTLSVASTTSGATWCTASATSGSKGTANVKFTVTENTDYDNRSVSVTIKSGTATKTFTISQKGVDALLVTTDKYEVSQEGGTIEIEVKANISYKMEISEKAKDWIKESSSRALTAYKHKLDIAANEEVEKREGEIIFKSGDKIETVKVYQAGGAIILLSQDEFTVSDAGETISVEIKSNVEFGVQMPDVDWITDETSSRGMSSHTLKYIISANDGYDSRFASIVFYDKNSDLKDTLSIVQIQKDAIIVANNEYRINSDGGILKFEVNTNVDFEVAVSVDWIKQNAETRSLETKSLSFTIDEYTALDKEREGFITISYGNLMQEIKVIQERKIFFNFSETEVNLTPNAGEFTIEVSTNGGYGIVMPSVDWLKQGEIRKVSDNTYKNTFIASENTTFDNREAEIKFHNVWTDEVVLVKICQTRNNIIHISSKEYSIDANGGVVSVELGTNVDYIISIPETAMGWISFEKDTQLDTYRHQLTFNANTNEDKDVRKAEILIKDKNSDLQETIFISQQSFYYIGDVTWKSLKEFKQFMESGYKKINGNLTIVNTNITDTIDIKEITGDLNIGCGHKTNLNIGNFYYLTKIGGSLNIGDNSEYNHYNSYPAHVYDFEGLKNLETIGGDFKISGLVADRVWYKDYTYGDGKYGNVHHAFEYLKTIELNKLKSIGGNLIVEIIYDKVTPHPTWHRWGIRTEDYGRAFKQLTSVRFDCLTSVGGEINIDDIFRDRSKDDIDIQINLPY